MKLHTTFSSVLKGLIVVSVVLFLSSAGFQDNRTSGWYQQFFPNLNGSSITSITFLDSLTGFAISNTNSSFQAYILKTSNGGDNWSIVYTYFPPSVNSGFTQIKFATDSIGFASTNYLEFYKTTNKGLNWINISTPPPPVEDMSLLNKDTILIVSSNGLAGGVYRSTNGGINWTALGAVGGSGQPKRIYMYDKNLGFTMSSSFMRRTTNGGFNWTNIPGESFLGIQFLDSLTGWKTYDGIKKTTDGGVSWISQQLPNISNDFMTSNLFALNKDTIWMVGARKYKSAPLYKTTNGGLNWGYQIPDTNLLIYDYYYVHFVNGRIGWLFRPTPLLLHTTTGGNDTTFFTGINNNESVSPTDYKLYQNYPNPFNPTTNIKYKILKSSEIKIRVYDIRGKEISVLVDEKKNPGEYTVSFNGNNLSSGIYFYTMYVNDVIIETKKMSMIK